MEHDPGNLDSKGPSAHPLMSLDEGDMSTAGSLPQEPFFSARAAGVAGILRREQEQAATTDRCAPTVTVRMKSRSLRSK